MHTLTQNSLSNSSSSMWCAPLPTSGSSSRFSLSSVSSNNFCSSFFMVTYEKTLNRLIISPTPRFWREILGVLAVFGLNYSRSQCSTLSVKTADRKKLESVVSVPTWSATADVLSFLARALK